MNYARVENDEVVQVGLPEVGVLKNGSSVSGYNLLDPDILKDEGWLPLEEEKPLCNEGEYLEFSSYEILVDKVVAKYIAKAIPPITPPPPSPLEVEVSDLWYTNMMLEGRIITEETETANLWYAVMMGGV